MNIGVFARSSGFVSLLLFLLVLPATAPAQEVLPPGLIGQIGGPVQTVVVSDDLIYAGVGVRMVVLQATTLEETGATSPFPQFVEDIAVDGTRAFVAAGGAGLRIVDVSDPSQPEEIGAWDSPGYAQGVSVSGNLVFLADGPLGLRILDVTNPALPVELAAACVMENVRKVALAGGYAYLAAGGSGLLVVDVTDPRRPVELAALDTPGHAYHVAIEGERAYVADGWEGVRVISISDPSHPSYMGAAVTNGWAMHLSVSHGRAFVANAGFGLLALDLTDPTRPSEIASWGEPPIAAIGVAALGSVAYVADRDRGVRAIDLSSPGAPRLIAGFHTIAGSESVVLQDRYAYVGAGFSGVHVVDVADPSRPVRVGGWEGGANIPTVRVRGSLLYAVSWGVHNNGLYTVDVSDPSKPRAVGYFDGDAAMRGRSYSAARDLEIEGDVAYIANEVGLIAVSIADPANPVYLGHVDIPRSGTDQSRSMDLVVGGRFAFIPDNRHLVVIDVSDPRRPSIAGTLATGVLGDEGIALYDQYLFMVGLDQRSAIEVVDISDPRHPRRVGSYPIAVQPFRLTTAGHELYVGARGAGVFALDVTRPTAPVFAGEADTPGLTHEIAASDELLAVADDAGGLLLFDRSALRDAAAISGSIAPPIVLATSRTPCGAARCAPPSIRTPRPFGTGVAASRPPTAGSVGQSCVVTSTADAGAGSLRACLEASGPGSRITFSSAVFPPDKPSTIRLATQLPPMSHGSVALDASEAGVILDGTDFPLNNAVPGLVILSSDNVVRGLAFVRFPGVAAWITGGARNVIGGNRLQGGGPHGQGNRFSANRGGLVLERAEDNVVSGNLFGVDAKGLASEPNRDDCLSLTSASARNRIGGAAAGEGNLLSGCGLGLGGPGTEFNLVIGNWMNTDITGLRPLGTGGGLYITDGASLNQIGGLSTGEANILSGSGYGVYMDGSRVRGNRIIGNLIGTNADATLAIPNIGPGINIEAAVSHTLVQGNIIFDNGVSLLNKHNYFNSIVGNRFVRTGAFVYRGAGYARIVGNTFEQIRGGAIRMFGTNECVIVGNRTDVGSLSAGPSSGVSLGEGARHNIIGGPRPSPPPTGRRRSAGPSAGFEEGNVLSGTSAGGIFLSGAGVEYNVIQGNRVGVDLTGRLPVPNRSNGIALTGGAAHNFVQGNTVAFNAWAGVQISGPKNLLRRNSIHDNGYDGIQTFESGTVLSAPVLTGRTATRVDGRACAGCTVEIYSDSADEGESYEGTVVADILGSFTFEKASGLRGPNVQAIASSAKGTSQYSSCVQALTPTSFAVASGGGTGSIVVTATDPCPWSVSTDSWITVTRSRTGVDFAVAANTDGRKRTAAIVIGGQIAVVTQAGS